MCMPLGYQKVSTSTLVFIFNCFQTSDLFIHFNALQSMYIEGFEGNELTEDRPSGADAEHGQGAKTINAEPQQRKRDEKRKEKTSAAYQKAEVERNIVNDIL